MGDDLGVNFDFEVCSSSESECGDALFLSSGGSLEARILGKRKAATESADEGEVPARVAVKAKKKRKKGKNQTGIREELRERDGSARMLEVLVKAFEFAEGSMTAMEREDCGLSAPLLGALWEPTDFADAASGEKTLILVQSGNRGQEVLLDLRSRGVKVVPLYNFGGGKKADQLRKQKEQIQSATVCVGTPGRVRRLESEGVQANWRGVVLDLREDAKGLSLLSTRETCRDAVALIRGLMPRLLAGEARLAMV